MLENANNASTKNQTAIKLDDLENQVDALRGDIGNITGRLSWVSRPADKNPLDSEKQDVPVPVQSSIVEQIERIIAKTDECIGVLRRTTDRLEV